MNQIIIENSKIHFGNDAFQLDDFYTSEFFEYCNSNENNYISNSYYVNELYLNTIQPFLALKYFITSNNIKKIKLIKPEKSLYIMSTILKNENIVKIENNRTNFFLIKQRLKNLINYNLSFIYISFFILKISKTKKIIKFDNEEIILIRTDAAKKKFQHFTQPKIIEDIKDKTSIYNQSSRIDKVKWLANIYIGGINELSKLKKETNFSVGKNAFYMISDFYTTRVVHTLLYEKILNRLFEENSKIKTIYTGNNLDRYSIVEEKLARKYKIKVIGIPHGLEYGFKFPKGFSGDIFYTTTQNASIFFNQLYNSKKFIFDENLMSKIFTINTKRNVQKKKVVFFTESREVEVNVEIIKLISPFLKDENIDLYLKLHPKDSPKNYAQFNSKIITHIEDSLVNNICFARKSTVLLECLYNNSKAASILINQKDKAIFSSFPSLRTDEIFVTEDINSLAIWIIKNYKNHEYI